MDDIYDFVSDLTNKQTDMECQKPKKTAKAYLFPCPEHKNKTKWIVENSAKYMNRPVSFDDNGAIVSDRNKAVFTVNYLGRDTYIVDQFRVPAHSQPSCIGSLDDTLRFIAGRVLFDL